MSHIGCIAAIAIEDRVDLLFRDGSTEYQATADIPEGGDYFANVYKLMETLLKLLVSKFKEKEKKKKKLRDLFNSVDSLVVSVPGVVHNNRRVVQIPLWHSDMQEVVRWQCDKKEKDYFDIDVELADIIQSLIEDDKDEWGERERQRFISRVFVVNDGTASAAFEYSKRREKPVSTEKPQAAADFVYVKIHNGINVGVVEQGDDDKVEVKSMHAEAGHGFPLLHTLDFKAGFQGICAYHRSCLEGMIAGHSFYKRAELGGEVFGDWQDYLNQLKISRPKLQGAALDNELIRYILGSDDKPPAGKGEGIELLAHYTAQLIYQLSIGPLVPGQIVVAGRMATPTVIEAIRLKVVTWANNYPLRDELTHDGVKKHIVRTLANDKEKKLIEAKGALAIAFSLSNRPISELRPLKRVDLKLLPETRESVVLYPKKFNQPK